MGNKKDGDEASRESDGSWGAEWPPSQIRIHFDRGSKEASEIAWLVATVCERVMTPRLGREVHTRVEPYSKEYRTENPEALRSGLSLFGWPNNSRRLESLHKRVVRIGFIDHGLQLI